MISDPTAFLSSTLPIARISAHLPPPSPLAKVDCRDQAERMTVREALQVLLSHLPPLPDLDKVALSAGDENALIRAYSAKAIVKALLE